MRRTSARLQQVSLEAVETLRDVQIKGESEAARVSAARAVLEYAHRAIELENLEARLPALEERNDVDSTTDNDAQASDLLLAMLADLAARVQPSNTASADNNAER
jgi:hypothetical protein